MAKPNTDTVPFVPDPAMVAALAKVKAAEDLVASVNGKIAAETAPLAAQVAAQQELALPALDSAKGMAAYDAAGAAVDKIRKQIAFLQLVKEGAEQKVATAKEELQKLGRATVIASQIRVGKARLRAATDVQEAIGNLGAAYLKLLDQNERNHLCWPNAAPIPPGAMCSPKEVGELIAVEFARVSSPADPLTSDARPPLPGAASTTHLGDPRKLKPFVAEIGASVDWLQRLVETGK